MKLSTSIQLAAMMFLQFFIWGAWYVTMGTYMSTHLQASGVQIGAAYSALAIATMISPFFVGMIADRYFAAQRLMGILHLIGAGLLYAATLVGDSTTFYWVILLYSLAYTPTLALTNSVAFFQMKNPGTQFPLIRVFGTVGWIIAGLSIGGLGIEKTPMTFHLAAGASLLLGVVSFMLPNTPPGVNKDTSTTSGLGLEAFVLLKDRSYLIFFISAILICIPLAFYYGFANLFLNEARLENAAGKMIMGQMSEAIFILAIPLLFNRLGLKKMLIIGMGAWVTRYLFFAYGNIDAGLWMLYAGIILHGVCYDFFFVTGYMYTQQKATDNIKNAAQGLFTFATYGVGMFIGAWYAGYVADGQVLVGGGHAWDKIWMVPAGIAGVVLLAFMLFFREEKGG
jgi:nucleoside transporter